MGKVIRIPRADVEHQQRFGVFHGAGAGVALPDGQEPAALFFEARLVEVALGGVCQMGMNAKPLFADIPLGDFGFLSLVKLAAVIRAHKLLCRQAVQLKRRQ